MQQLSCFSCIKKIYTQTTQGGIPRSYLEEESRRNKKMDFPTIVSCIGTVTALFLLGSPGVVSRRMYVARNFEDLSINYFAVQLVNCVAWSLYGVLIESVPVTFCNAFGVAVAIFSMLCYLDVKRQTDLKLYPLHLRTAAASAGLSAVITFLVMFLNAKGEGGIAHTLSGMCGAIFSVSLLASPLEQMMKIIKEKVIAGALQPMMVYSGTVNAFMWTFYGLLVYDFIIIVPNGLGFLFTCAQVVLLALYPATSKKVEGSTVE